MAAKVVPQGFKQVKPILSVNNVEARRRVFNLYKAWYRQLPHVVRDYDIPVTIPDLQAKLREKFLKHKHVTDIRSIDFLVIQGQMELIETMRQWKQKHHIMSYFNDETVNPPKPNDFLSKFYDGHE